MSELILEIRDVVVRYGQIAALDRVSIDVREREVVALVGANGAGKSTLLKSIVGHLRPNAGTMRFAGAPLDGLAPWQRARHGIGYSPEGRRIFPAMTVRENLEVAGGSDRRERAIGLEAVFHLFPALGARQAVAGWQLSGGQQQMLAIGRALMRRARLVVLDEPSLGLSPILAREVLLRIRDIAALGGAVLLADQNIAGALAIADRGYVMQAGRIVAEGEAGALRRGGGLATALLG